MVTVPNVICAVRMSLAPALVALAIIGQAKWFVALYLALALSDWIDGKLALLLNQRSAWGARLDTVADLILYGCLLLGSSILAFDALRDAWQWIAAALVSYLLSVGAARRKFGRWPAYHTRGAKTAWFLVLVSAVCVHSGQSLWMLKATMLVVMLVNLESLLITRVLREWTADVPSLWHAMRQPGTSHGAC